MLQIICLSIAQNNYMHKSWVYTIQLKASMHSVNCASQHNASCYARMTAVTHKPIEQLQRCTRHNYGFGHTLLRSESEYGRVRTCTE